MLSAVDYLLSNELAQVRLLSSLPVALALTFI
jgi:hypothetical protein